MYSEKKSDAHLRTALQGSLPNIWRFALSLAGNPDTADELTQATCLRALEKSEQFTGDGNPVGWFLKICRSIWLNQLRSQKIRASQSLDSVPEHALNDLKSDTETNIFAREVFTKVISLPEAQREAVVLVYVEGFSYREAAKLLEIPIGTVMSRLSAARQKLAGLNVEPQHLATNKSAK
jgi:RNA polymerase sigma-70 factor (ECF subfamily)